MYKFSFSIHIICLLFFTEVFCQNLTLKINGKTDLETRIIDSLGYLEVHSDFASIKSEVNTIQKKLYRMGFIESEVIILNKIDVSSFQYEMHLKNKSNLIYIYFNKVDIDSSILNLVSKEVFKDYFILNFFEIESALHIINSEISKKGFPFSKLQLSDIKVKRSSNLQANLTTNTSGTKRLIDDILIKGYEKFPKSFLKHFLKIKSKQVLNLDIIKEKTKQLANLGFANELKAPEVLFSKDSTTLYLYMEKAQSNNFDGFLGFGTNEETNKIEFDGYLNLNLVNNLNLGESFTLLYKSDENDQKTFEVDVSLPYIFKTPIGLDLLLRIFKKDSSFTTVNQSAKLNYQINSKHKLYGGIISTESNNLQSGNTTVSVVDYKTNHYSFAYQFLKTQFNNLLFPIKSKVYIETGFGKRRSSNITQKQNQIFTETFNIFKLNLKNSFYIRANGSNLISDTYFENELLRFGGINSLRGFEENSLFASLYGFVNSEYRYQLNNSIYIHTIFDAGYFENKILKTKEKLFGYGFGFGILTKSGLLRLNFANGKNENSKFKLSNSKIHISLRANF